jgi:succinate dehydrogenase / fumarate reductase flavoprotein subunit
VDRGEVDAIGEELLAPFGRAGTENPYAIQADLQETMQRLVGIVRVERELQEALTKIEALKQRARQVRVVGPRTYNPSWHTALDLTSLLAVAESVTLAALERKESRGGHTRDDYPATDAGWSKVNVVVRRKNGTLQVAREALSEMPAELRALVQETT